MADDAEKRIASSMKRRLDAILIGMSESRMEQLVNSKGLVNSDHRSGCCEVKGGSAGRN